MFPTGASRTPQEGTHGTPGPDPDLRPAAAVHCEEPHCGQGSNLHQGGQCHPGDQKPHERYIKGGDNLLCLRHQGESCLSHSLRLAA